MQRIKSESGVRDLHVLSQDDTVAGIVVGGLEATIVTITGNAREVWGTPASINPRTSRV